MSYHACCQENTKHQRTIHQVDRTAHKGWRIDSCYVIHRVKPKKATSIPHPCTDAESISSRVSTTKRTTYSRKFVTHAWMQSDQIHACLSQTSSPENESSSPTHGCRVSIHVTRCPLNTTYKRNVRQSRQNPKCTLSFFKCGSTQDTSVNPGRL